MESTIETYLYKHIRAAFVWFSFISLFAMIKSSISSTWKRFGSFKADVFELQHSEGKSLLTEWEIEFNVDLSVNLTFKCEVC